MYLSSAAKYLHPSRWPVQTHRQRCEKLIANSPMARQRSKNMYKILYNSGQIPAGLGLSRFETEDQRIRSPILAAYDRVSSQSRIIRFVNREPSLRVINQHISHIRFHIQRIPILPIPAILRPVSPPDIVDPRCHHILAVLRLPYRIWLIRAIIAGTNAGCRIDRLDRGHGQKCQQSCQDQSVVGYWYGNPSHYY